MDHQWDITTGSCRVCGLTEMELVMMPVICVCPGKQRSTQMSTRSHIWIGLGSNTSPATCSTCGVSASSIGGVMSCSGPHPSYPIKFTYSDATDALKYALVGIDSGIAPAPTSKTCTCPLHGPEGLLARGCSCGGS